MGRGGGGGGLGLSLKPTHFNDEIVESMQRRTLKASLSKEHLLILITAIPLYSLGMAAESEHSDGECSEQQAMVTLWRSSEALMVSDNVNVFVVSSNVSTSHVPLSPLGSISVPLEAFFKFPQNPDEQLPPITCHVSVASFWKVDSHTSLILSPGQAEVPFGGSSCFRSTSDV